MSEYSRLKWLCRRGVKELDIVLTGYLESAWEDAPEREKTAFAALLAHDDPHLFDLLVGNKKTDDEPQRQLLEKLRRQVQARRAGG